MRSLARRLGLRGRRPHISRIERRRGPVRRYGESARGLSGLTPRLCPARSAGGDRRAVRRRGGGDSGALWRSAGRGSRSKRSGKGKKPHRRRLERFGGVGEDGRSRWGQTRGHDVSQRKAAAGDRATRPMRRMRPPQSGQRTKGWRACSSACGSLAAAGSPVGWA